MVTRFSCSVAFLRSLNLAVNCFAVPSVVRGIQILLVFKDQEAKKRKTPSQNSQFLNTWAGHTSINIALFPLLFFFSALYYTDVVSTFSVLASYWLFLLFEPEAVIPRRPSSIRSGSLKGLTIFFAGLVSLTFRQTNIFWVSVFLGGLELVRTLKAIGSRGPSSFKNDKSLEGVFRRSWKHTYIYDPPAAEANIAG